MRLNFKNKHEEIMIHAGYKKHWGGYIKLDEAGRFHGKLQGKNVMDIHYDVFVDGGKNHFSIHMPIKISAEIQRIKEIDNIYVKKETEEEYKGRMQKARKKAWRKKHSKKARNAQARVTEASMAVS